MNKVPTNNAKNIMYNSNFSLEIGTYHIYPTDTNEALLKDVKDGVDTCAQNDTNKTVLEDVKDRVEARAPNDDGNGNSNDISHGQNHKMRSGYFSNRINNLGYPS